LAQRDPLNLVPAYIQIDNSEMLEKLVLEHEIVVSFIPPFLHHYVAQACLKLGKNMTTSSYISQHMKDISS
jgi:saccharopine dehydrogenase (NADP+, L-glutamate forming)